MKNLILLSLLFSKIAMGVTNDEATAMVKASLQNTVVASEKSYCTHGTMTCRTMYLLKDKTTGAPSNVYYDTFYSADRQVGSTCYFIPLTSDPKQYYVFTDSVFDGKLAIDLVSPTMATITASADFSHIVFGNLKSPKIGTTIYTLGSFAQSDDVVTLDGTSYDSQDPNYKQPVHIDYFRVNP